MYTIAVGTVSKQKNEFLREILDELKIDAKTIPLSVKSEVSDQPITDQETRQGSVNRAKNALKLFSESDFSIGIEVGYDLNEQNDYEMFCWVTIIDQTGKQVSACSHKFILPKFHQKILKKNGFLGNFVRQYLEENNDFLSQHVGVIIRDRKPFIQTAIKSAILSYLL